MKQIICLTTILVTLHFHACSNSATGPQNEISETEFQNAMNNYLTENSSILGMIALVEKPGKGTISGTSGKFDLNDSKPLQISDKFHIGSTTKTFVATIVLQLMEEGLLELDSAIINYLPSHITDILIEIPYGQEISVYHLLAHRSGLYNFTDEPECAQKIYENSNNLCDAEFILNAVKDYGIPRFKPGEEYSYPGNVRELIKIIKNAAFFTEEDEIKSENIDFGNSNENYDIWSITKNKSLTESKRQFEKDLIERRLKEFDNDIQKTADSLNLIKNNLYRKLKQHGIDYNK